MKSIFIIVLILFSWKTAEPGLASRPGGNKTVSFKENVFPIIHKNCLPCHAEDNFNPSELSMDRYENLMEGGKHGTPIVPGDSKASILIGKVGPNPPFGDRMPLNMKGKKDGGVQKVLTDEEIRTIMDWIDQGAKNN